MTAPRPCASARGSRRAAVAPRFRPSADQHDCRAAEPAGRRGAGKGGRGAACTSGSLSPSSSLGRVRGSCTPALCCARKAFRGIVFTHPDCLLAFTPRPPSGPRRSGKLSGARARDNRRFQALRVRFEPAQDQDLQMPRPEVRDSGRGEPSLASWRLTRPVVAHDEMSARCSCRGAVAIAVFTGFCGLVSAKIGN